jgi:hypothetical protein
MLYGTLQRAATEVEVHPAISARVNCFSFSSAYNGVRFSPILTPMSDERKKTVCVGVRMPAVAFLSLFLSGLC